MSNLDKLKATLAEARQAASTAVATTTSTGGEVTTMVQPGRPVSVHEILSQGPAMTVKDYLKVDRVAFLIGKDESLFKEFEVEFGFDEVKAFFGVRYGAQPARYERSYDRQVNARNGQAWHQTVADAQRIDPRCRGDYSGVDIPFTVLADIKGEGGKVIVEKGEKIGWTSSITNFKDFKEFAKDYYELIAAGLLGPDARVRGKIKHVKRRGGDNDYGALTFEGFDVVDNGTLQSAEAA